MRRIDTIVIGGGQAGLAMSRCLVDRGIEHVVLERGRVGERWRSQRWDSLHLLTPRWQTRLPGWSYQGPDPDGFMSKDELVSYLEDYAHAFPVPLETGVTVTSVRRDAPGFRVDTDRGSWHARSVVVATGECDRPVVPALASGISRDVHQVVTTKYKNPNQLPDGGVLIVGASATGIQLAAEIQASGRPVTLSVGPHTRLPRTYRGRDILWWFDRMGIFDERAEEVKDLERSRRQPSMQLIGSSDHRTLDLDVLGRAGVRLTGRTAAASGQTVIFEDDLVETRVAADVKLARLQKRIDDSVMTRGLAGAVEQAPPFEAAAIEDGPRSVHLRDERIRTVLWATGFEPAYDWLHVPVLDARGEISHEGGVTPEPGLYVLGLRFQRRRNSNFIDGVGRDAMELCEHMAAVRRLTRHQVA